MQLSLQGKKVLVTGASRGIGAAIAIRMVEAGAEVHGTATVQASVEEFKKSYPKADVSFEIVDFAKEADLLNYAGRIKDVGFDVLVNNAGINKVAHTPDVSLSDWQMIQDVNTKAPFVLSQSVSKKMSEKKWGRIVNISSVFGVVSKQERVAYSTSKSALIGMTKTLALDLAQENILVNAVSPGFIDTELTRRVLGEKGIAEMVTQVPLRRLGQADDVAGLVLYLASELNSFITGENIVIDGGFTCA